jgi:nucleoside-diphosphate-sugar epimerase
VLVTGGGGFLGRAVVEQLIDRGDSVRSLARREYPDLRAMGVEVLRGDIGDADAVRAACLDCDAVIHVAAKAGVWGGYREYYEPNVRGTENVIAACRAAGGGRLVYTSTPSVVFDGRDMAGVDESAPYPKRFFNHYGATKAAAERAVLAANGGDLRTLALRPHLIWGPGDTQLLPRFVAQQRAGKLRRLGRGEHLIDTTYIDDAARAHVLALDALQDNPNAAGRAYFISQGEPIPLWHMINGMLAAAGCGPVTRVVPPFVGCAAGAILEGVHALFGLKTEPRMTRFVAHILTAAHWFDISAARRELGYEPRVTIGEGLARLKEWIDREKPCDSLWPR